MHRHNGTDYSHANECPHCWREASDIQSAAIDRLSAWLAEKELECERLRDHLMLALDHIDYGSPDKAREVLSRALENDDG